MAVIVNGKSVSYIQGQSAVAWISGSTTSTSGNLLMYVGTSGKVAADSGILAASVLTSGGGGGGGASFWSGLGAVTYSASPQFTVSGGYSGIIVGTPLKYLISGVVCYGDVSYSGTTYSGGTTAVYVRGVPLSNGLTSAYVGDLSRIGQIAIPMPGYWEAATVSTYLNSNQLFPGGYPWDLPTAYIIGYNFQTATIDSGTGTYVNLVVNGNQFSSLNSNKGLAVTTTGNIWTATDLNLISSTNPTISYGQYLDINVTAGTSGNATNAMMVPICVIP